MIWRNICLTGVRELRKGIKPRQYSTAPLGDVMNATPIADFPDMLAARLNPGKMGDSSLAMALHAAENGESSLVSVRNAVLVAEMGKSVPAPDVALRGTKSMLMRFFLRKTSLDNLETEGLKVSGDRAALLALLDAVDAPPGDYPISTP